MNRFACRSNDGLAPQQASPAGSLPPRPIGFVAQVLPPSKLTPSNIPAVSPASAWPTLVTITMLLGLAGLTAIASSDSFRCRWLTSTLAGTAGPAATRAAAGTPASVAAAVAPAITIANRKRYKPSPFPLSQHDPAHPGPCPQYERSAHNREPAADK